MVLVTETCTLQTDQAIDLAKTAHLGSVHVKQTDQELGSVKKAHPGSAHVRQIGQALGLAKKAQARPSWRKPTGPSQVRCPGQQR